MGAIWESIGRIGEEVSESNYQGMQQFISDSPWDAEDVMAQVRGGRLGGGSAAVLRASGKTRELPGGSVCLSGAGGTGRLGGFPAVSSGEWGAGSGEVPAGRAGITHVTCLSGSPAHPQGADGPRAEHSAADGARYRGVARNLSAPTLRDPQDVFAATPLAALGARKSRATLLLAKSQ